MIFFTMQIMNDIFNNSNPAVAGDSCSRRFIVYLVKAKQLKAAQMTSAAWVKCYVSGG